jgi:hypothetical protein
MYDSGSNTGPLTGCFISSDYDATHTAMNLTFHPYKFDLSTLTLVTSPNGANDWVYMNNLNSSTPDYRMAVKIEGNITAQGKDGGDLSNFTSGCAATDVRLWLVRSMSPGENFVSDVDGNTVDFQQVLKDENSIYHLSTDKNISTLTKSNFVDTAEKNGTATIDLHYNFAKPYTAPVNIVDVNFSTLYADAQSAVSYADQKNNYIPEGNFTMDSNRSFLFARVAPAEGTDDTRVYTPDTTLTTTMRINVFCQDTLDISCNRPGVLPISPEETLSSGGGWYRMNSHDTSLGDGEIISLTSSVTGVSINPAVNISLTGGVTPDITISYPVTGRPIHPTIMISPDEWLKYKKDDTRCPSGSDCGKPDFLLHFLTQGLRWKGTGKTGHVIETEPNINKNKRINW